MIDLEKLLTLGAFAVSSGTFCGDFDPDDAVDTEALREHRHAHVYVSLTEPVTGPQHKALCHGLGKFLGAVDSKVCDNDLLRPVSTYNFKRTGDW